MRQRNVQSFFDWAVHNVYKGACLALRNPLVRIVSDPSIVRLQKLQTARSFTLSNEFEVKIYPNRQAKHICLSPDVYLWELNNGFIVSDTAFPYTSKQKLVAISQDVLNSPEKSTRRPIPLLARQIESPLFHFSGGNNENRAHFRTQFLPRLISCLPFLQSRPDVKILIASGHKSWQRQYFDILGIPADRLIECSLGTWKVKQLYYAPFLYSDHVLSDPVYYKEIRNVFAPPQKGDKVLFVSRADAPSRRISNEDALFNLVKSIWPKAQRVIMRELNLREQIVLFSQARIVIGGHGAGLSAILFCSQALLFQITPFDPNESTGWTMAFNQLASAVGCRAVRLDARPTWQEGNYNCDLESLKSEILRVMEIETKSH